MLKKSFMLFLISLLTGCATAYQPMGLNGGYNEIRLNENTFKVSFLGNEFTNRETVQNLMLYRCAELTRSRGYEYFTVVNANEDKQENQHTTPTTISTETKGSSGGHEWGNSGGFENERSWKNNHGFANETDWHNRNTNEEDVTWNNTTNAANARNWGNHHNNHYNNYNKASSQTVIDPGQTYKTSSYQDTVIIKMLHSNEKIPTALCAETILESMRGTVSH